MAKLRVFYATNIETSIKKDFQVPVNTPEEGILVINALADYQLTLPESIVSSNMFLLEQWNEQEEDWEDWYSEEGLDYQEYEDKMKLDQMKNTLINLLRYFIYKKC